MIITYIIAALFLTILGVLFLGGDHKLKLKVRSVSNDESFIVEKKNEANGNSFLDWFYYDENGNKIEDENLKKMIFEAFSDEDWYGDYEFYTKANTKEAIETSEPA